MEECVLLPRLTFPSYLVAPLRRQLSLCSDFFGSETQQRAINHFAELEESALGYLWEPCLQPKVCFVLPAEGATKPYKFTPNFTITQLQMLVSLGSVCSSWLWFVRWSVGNPTQPNHFLFQSASFQRKSWLQEPGLTLKHRNVRDDTEPGLNQVWLYLV